MPKMLSLRSFHLSSKSGHSVNFEPNVPTEVPAVAMQEAMAAGCVPCDLNDAPGFDNTQRIKVDFQGDVRRSIIYLAVKSVMDDNNVKDFDGAGMPKRTVVSDRLGIDVNPKELTDVYQTYTAAKAEGRAFALHESAPNIIRVCDAKSLSDLLDLADEFGEKREKYKGQQTRDVRRALLVKFSGITLV